MRLAWRRGRRLLARKPGCSRAFAWDPRWLACRKVSGAVRAAGGVGRRSVRLQSASGPGGRAGPLGGGRGTRGRPAATQTGTSARTQAFLYVCVLPSVMRCKFARVDRRLAGCRAPRGLWGRQSENWLVAGARPGCDVALQTIVSQRAASENRHRTRNDVVVFLFN